VAFIFVERGIREGEGLQDKQPKGHTLVCGRNRHGDRVLTGLESEAPGMPVVPGNSMEPERFDGIRTGTAPVFGKLYMFGDELRISGAFSSAYPAERSN
jgi:hypothetical protein